MLKFVIDELPPMDDTVDLDDESVVTTATSESGVDVAIIQRIINTGFISRVRFSNGYIHCQSWLNAYHFM